MPIRPENQARYPADWKLRSRFVREVRAGNRCEWCGVPQYAVGQRIGGRFKQVQGSIYLDDMQYAKSYREARSLATHLNRIEDVDSPYIVIVLTVAHVHDHRPEAASLLNLAALCQRCHNCHDATMRRLNRRARLSQSSPQLLLL